jgi:hypothetical protein
MLHVIRRSLARIARSLVRSLARMAAGSLDRSLDVAGIARCFHSLGGMVRWSGFVADTFVRRSRRSRCARGRLLLARALPRLVWSLLLRSCFPCARFVIDFAVLSHPISWLGASVVRHVDELTSRREGEPQTGVRSGFVSPHRVGSGEVSRGRGDAAASTGPARI